MTVVIIKVGTAEGGKGASGQEIIKMSIGDIHLRGRSPDPGVLQGITETQTFDSETGIETFKMTGGEKEKGGATATDLMKGSDREIQVMDILESPSA